MRILVACEYSGVVSAAFRKKGHETYSCDLLPTEGESLWHFQQSIWTVLWNDTEWDMLIAHPPCTYLSVSGLHWNKRRPMRDAYTQNAIKFVEVLWNCGISKIAIENPVGVLSTRSTLGKPTQIIQPYEFGEDASKRTCLWLKGLPKLKATQMVAPRMVDGKPRWANQTDSGQNRLGPSETRGLDRSRTYQGIADAMADQWGGSSKSQNLFKSVIRFIQPFLNRLSEGTLSMSRR